MAKPRTSESNDGPQLVVLYHPDGREYPVREGSVEMTRLVRGGYSTEKPDAEEAARLAEARDAVVSGPPEPPVA
jgi:hypothetical protein